MGQYIYLFSLIYDCCCLVLQMYSAGALHIELPYRQVLLLYIYMRYTPEGCIIIIIIIMKDVLLSRDNTPGLFSFYPVRWKWVWWFWWYIEWVIVFPVQDTWFLNLIFMYTFDFGLCTIASKIDVTPKDVALSEKLQLTSALCNEIF